MWVAKEIENIYRVSCVGIKFGNLCDNTFAIEDFTVYLKRVKGYFKY